MRTASWLGLCIGVAIAVALVAWQGVNTVAGLLASTNWKLLLVAVFALPQLVLSTASWRLLFPSGGQPRFALAFLALWIGYSINLMLPVASLGGDVVRARLLAIWSGKPRDAVASVVVDKTVLVATLPILGVIGTAALFRVVPDAGSLGAAIGSVILLAIGLVLLVLVQKAGVFAFLAARAVRLARRTGWDGLVAKASDLDGAIRALYRRPATVAASCGLRVLARLSLCGEVWLAARLLGHPITIADAILLKSFTIVARAAAFPVPAGLGVQEGSFVALGALIGLPPDVALATSLATRVREIVSSVPGLLAWQTVEGRGLWRRRAA
ncbi:MAG TPA: lysylphosphatidylglycerol synthase domain-containing protein [Thermoanaerobaculia bacterium]|jgi:putative membrane protein